MADMLRKYGIFLIIPGIVLGSSILLKFAAGPYWLASNFDPSYQYLVNGLYLIKGYVPNHSDHPGTPLQILSCAVCWLFNIGRSSEDVVRHVLMAPEFYLGAIFALLSLFAFLSSFGLAVYVYRKTNDRMIAVLTQLPIVSFLVLKSWETAEPVLPVVANVDPEPLLISILCIFNICLLMDFFARTSKEKYIAVLIWGFVCGLGSAVKLTFVPLLAVPLIVLSWKNKILFSAVFAASFVLWTLPILSKYHIIAGWISGIIMHRGSEGAGGTGIGSILYSCMDWKGIFAQHTVYVSFLCVSIVLIIWKFVEKKWDRGALFLAAAVAGVTLQFTAVTQHAGAHYLLPGMGLFSSILVLFYLQFSEVPVLRQRITAGIIVICICSGFWQAMEYRSRLEGLTRDIIRFHDQVLAKYQNCTFIDYYRSSDEKAALFFGDGWNLSPRLGKELFSLYPNKYYFQIWGRRILDFNGLVWANDLLAQNSCVLFRGDGGYDFDHGPYQVHLLEKGPFESIQALTNTTEKQAAILIAAAVRFYEAGQPDKAIACALQARKLHYQPDVTVESLIKLFGGHPGS